MHWGGVQVRWWTENEEEWMKRLGSGKLWLQGTLLKTQMFSRLSECTWDDSGHFEAGGYLWMELEGVGAYLCWLIPTGPENEARDHPDQLLSADAPRG